MERDRLLIALSVIVLLAVGTASAQEAVAVEAGAPAYGMGFGTVMCSGGWVGVLNWLGILGWAVAALPLGILSAVHCGTSRMRQLPLTTKVLILGSAWVMALGLTGFAQGAIHGLSMMALMEAGAAQSALLALNVAHSLYSLLAAVFVCQFNLLFLLISMVIRHHRRRDILVGP